MKYDPYNVTPELAVALWDLYAEDPARWIRECVQIHDGSDWTPFDLWPSQLPVVEALLGSCLKALFLKARQIGLTWLALACGLHLAIFSPGTTGLIVSLREDEAKEALARLRGVYDRLPAWQRARSVVEDSSTCLALSTGSTIHALPSHRGDSYTARWALIDEAALIPDLGRLLGSLSPTVADGGRLWLVSRANKRDPSGTFARLARTALLEGGGDFVGVFLPWHARPGRDDAFYAAQQRASLQIDGTLDTLHEQYPATAQEALAPSTADRRLPAAWLEPATEITPHRAGDVAGVWVYRAPDPRRVYVLGVDPAEGLSTGDDSAVCLVDKLTGEEVAAAAGKWEPKAILPQLVKELSDLFGGSAVLVERNNHGHAVIGALQTLGVPLVSGPDGQVGYVKSPSSKAQLWVDVGAELRTRAEARTAALAQNQAAPPPLVRGGQTYRQLSLLEAGTCKAPDGELDDSADAWGLAQWARSHSPGAWLDKILEGR